MIFRTKQTYFLYVYLFSVFGLLFYLYGFFPMNRTFRMEESSSNGISNYSISKHIDKLAFIVIDSLRFDFVLASDNSRQMPFTTSSILKNESCLVAIKADSPTVTMPRIKAITSGISSTYVDVLLNFMSSHFEEENFVTNAILNGLKVLFYGDDTWLKLFPSAFLRSEGTNSFFALDFTEVDTNVTRHIDKELGRDDWDIIILHYLGLDHIGHLEGPKSPLVKPKLKEMDDVIKKISNHLKMLEKRNGIRTMVIVTGDHGMKDSGGHGGVTFSEVTVPLISVGNPCRHLPGWPKNYTAFQTDIASTVSAILGIKFPSKSVGKIIPDLLHGMESSQILKCLEINRMQLNRFIEFSKGHDFNTAETIIKEQLSNISIDENREKRLVKKYFKYLNQVSQDIANSRSDCKVFYLLLGLIILWVSLLVLVYQLIDQFYNAKKKSKIFLIFGIISHGLSLASTSLIEEEHQTWYFLWMTFCLLMALEFFSMEKLSLFQKLKFSLLWINLCFVHRILRKLNQTGDKWSFLPDIKIFLNSIEGQPWLVISCLSGILMMYLFALRERCSCYQLIFFGLSLICCICFRLSTGIFKISFTKLYPDSRGRVEIALFWTFFSLFSILTIHNKTSLFLIWLLLNSLTLRPHNIILLPLQVFASKLIYASFQKDTFWNSVAHVWLGNVFYFYQGNSNSLANVDVAPGFIGISSYNPFYAGFMIIVHTFNGQILSFILSPKINSAYVFLRIIPITFYCTFLLFQLNHLFIWSVFSPKLLYEASATLVFLGIIFCNTLLNKNFLFSFSDHEC